MSTLDSPRGWLTREAIRAICETEAELRRRRRSRTISRSSRLSLSGECVDVVLFTVRMVSIRGIDRVAAMASNAANVSVATAVSFVTAAIALYEAFPRRLQDNSTIRPNGSPTIDRDDRDDDPITRIPTEPLWFLRRGS